MAILITGGAGFIGRNLVEKLIEKNYEVVVADKHELNIGNEKVITVTGDLLNPPVLAKSFEHEIEAVVHLAGKTRVLESIAQSDIYFENNVSLTHKVLQMMRERGVKKIVFASTNAVAGNKGDKILTEDEVLNPLTPYGATKAACEMLLRGWAKSQNLSASILRLTNIFGPYMDKKDSFIPRIIRAILTNGTIEVYGDGTQTRDFLFVEQVCKAIIKSIEDKGFGAQTLIIGSGTSISVNELIERLGNMANADLKLVKVAKPEGEMPHVRVNVDKAKALGYELDFDIDFALKSTYEYFKKLKNTG